MGHRGLSVRANMGEIPAWPLLALAARVPGGCCRAVLPGGAGVYPLRRAGSRR